MYGLRCESRRVSPYVWESGRKQRPATETEKGEKQRTCSVCGYVDIEEIPVLPHTHSFGTEWKSDGTSHWHDCAACGAKTDEAAHSFKWVTDKAATATEKGIKHEECTVCGYQKEAVEIPAAGTRNQQSAGQQPKRKRRQCQRECPNRRIQQPNLLDRSADHCLRRDNGSRIFQKICPPLLTQTSFSDFTSEKASP